MTFCKLVVLAMMAAVLPAWAQSDFQGATHITPFEDEPINYLKVKPEDPVARLRDGIGKGSARLEREDAHGYLESVLKALEIPQSSQVLVFSKTSMQRDRISPSTPRALYFNDDVYVGFIPGSPLMEISSAD